MQLNGAKIRDYYRLGSDINTEDEAAVVFKIPHFQRPYKWSDQQIQALINDHSENAASGISQSPYFAGAVVTAVEPEFHSLIDGQQRYTTLFLANYIRFLLYRAYFAIAIDRRDYKARELAPHFEKVCQYTFLKFDFLSSDWLKDCIDGVMEDADRCVEIKKQYLTKLFLPDLANDDDSYINSHFELLRVKLRESDLLLSYDRTSFNDHLKEALSRVTVFLSSEAGPSFDVRRDDDLEPSVIIYLDALDCLFNSFHENAKEQSDSSKWNKSAPFKVTKVIESIDCFMKDLRFCVVQTGRKEDAYTLFEVLNDRALSLDDLDIAKNYFYKKYVTWSQNNLDESEAPDVIDKTLDSMDELWGEKVFNGGAEYLKRLTSYLGVVYLSGSNTLVNEKGEGFRDCISKYLGSQVKYRSQELKADFGVFYNVKRILEAVGLSGNLKEKLAIKAICDPSASYIKKFFLLAHALNFNAVMPGVMNPLLREVSNWSENCFENKFKPLLKAEEARRRASKIEELAFNLFNQILASSDHKQPRELVSSNVIPTIFSGTTCDVQDLSMQNFRVTEKHLESFEKWITTWQFGKAALRTRVRALLVILLGAKLDDDELKLNSAFSMAPVNAEALTLDHLEPSKPNKFNAQEFFEHDERHRIVNGLGNMMLLDHSSNSNKNNNPMETCFDVLEKAGLGNHWLTVDIRKILDRHHETKVGVKVPNEDFFHDRAVRLKKFMKAALKHPFLE